MNLPELDAWCRSFLEIEAFKKVDDSLNGIQVGRSEGPVTRVAFAVDACAETIRRAAEEKAQVLFVHHGLFWGSPARIQGALMERVRTLLDRDMALYACHLPLDAHPEYGNNAVLARMLGLSGVKPFGFYKGISLGFRGVLDPAPTLEEAVRRILPDGSEPRAVLPFGPDRISSAAVVSGGAPHELFEAVEEGLDLYVTGEPSHSVYHAAQESGINFVAAGHYATEVWGVRAVAEKLARETGTETVFVEVPTGL
ncbi:MAG TPA: Nif3-like dinuclear metal center hexameric protein [Spirochaetales bacterium]|nr:Nif3-like dinuclear metal center hexameric protein [Spirochaetales bacterium]